MKAVTKPSKTHVLCSKHQGRQCHADLCDFWCSVLLSPRLIPDKKQKFQGMAKTSFCFSCPVFWYCLKDDFSGRYYLVFSHIILKICKKYSSLVKTINKKKNDYRTHLNMLLIILNCFSRRTVLLIIARFCRASLRCRLENVVGKLSQHVYGLSKYY